MTRNDLDELHRNPGHWHAFFFYFCPADPRIVVRRRIGALGWTLNFARWLAVPFLTGLIGWVFGCLALLDYLDVSDSAKWFGVFLIITSIVGICIRLSDTRRHAAG